MTDIILKFIKIFKSMVGFLLPDAIFNLSIFSNFLDTVEWFVDFLVAVNFLVPLPTIFMALKTMVSIKVIKFTIFLGNWLVRRVCDVIP